MDAPSDAVPPAALPRVIFVSGPSGAGRTTAIRVLEDLGFEAIDNMPLSLIPRLLDGAAPERPLALGTDTRNRDWSAAAVLDHVARLDARGDVDADLLYLDCRPDVLERRFSETRRRHPLAPGERVGAGIARELDLLAPLKERAGILVDTSDLNVHEFRDLMHRHFAPQGRQHLAVTIQSFSYKRGLPPGADLVFDCRFLKNPHWEPALRPQDGRAAPVQSHIAQDPAYEPFAAGVEAMLLTLLPAFRSEGKAHLTIAFGCTGGRHRSVALTERLAATLDAAGWQVSSRHRELERAETREAGPA